MEIGKIFQGILGKDILSADDIHTLLGRIDIQVQPSECKVLLYKRIERALLRHYKEVYGIDLTLRVYSINEINGLILFLYIKKHRAPEIDSGLEMFFEKLFFRESGELGIKDLRAENERLMNANMELREKVSEMNNMWIDKGFEDVGFKNVDAEVLSRMEKELLLLKEQLDFEHSAILEAWYNLGEEYMKNK